AAGQYPDAEWAAAARGDGVHPAADQPTASGRRPAQWTLEQRVGLGQPGPGRQRLGTAAAQPGAGRTLLTAYGRRNTRDGEADARDAVCDERLGRGPGQHVSEAAVQGLA